MNLKDGVSKGIGKPWGQFRSWYSSRQIRFPILAKITLPYLFLAILLAITGAFLVTNIVFDSVEVRYLNQLAELGQLTSELMVVEEDKLLETLRFLTNSPNVVRAFADGNPEDIRQMAFGIVINQQAESVEFLDKDRNLVLAMRHIPGGGIEEYAFTTGGENLPYKNMDFVNKVIDLQDDALGDKFSGFVQADWGNYFYVSGPANDPEFHFNGVILVGTSMHRLAKSIQENALGQITFYGMDGQVLDTSHPFTVSPLSDEFASTILATQHDDRSLLREFSELREVQVGSLDYTEIFLPWEVRGDVDLGIIGAALPKNFIVSQTPLTRIQTTAIVSMAFFLVLLIGYYLANLITRPLRKLVDASTHVSGGDLSVRVDLETNDEINMLAASFNHMISSLDQSRKDIIEAYDSALEGWAKALELRDKETQGHTDRVTDLTVALAREFDFTEEELANIRRGALLHDIGKMGIPDKILHKPGSLSQDEWVIMRKHPVYAYEMLKNIKFLQSALDIPRYHHEHWDGNGYPYGLAGEQIPLAARIFAVVDCWDALTSDRPYRNALSIEETFLIMEDSAGKIYDPKLVAKFRSYIEKLSELESGELSY